jgi:cell division septation protein DedD
MGNEEKIDGAGVEVENRGPENLQPHVLDAVVVDAVVMDAVAVEPAHVAAPANAPDFYAVGVRLIKMSPVWLLTVTGGFAFLILLLSWMRPGAGAADAASIPNDAKSVVVQPQSVPAAKPVEETPAPSKEERAEVVAETRAPEPVKTVEAKPSAPEPAPAEEQKRPAAVVTPPSDAGGKFTVQVGSFNAESQANERISSLRAAGFDARSTAVEIPGRGRWHRVHVGRFGTREEAAKAAAQLRAKAAAASSMVVPVQ